jgi:predicted phosphodiesterase
LLAVSDLHVRYPENRQFVQDLRPESDRDWLLVAGDAGLRRVPDLPSFMQYAVVRRYLRRL